MTQKKRIRFLIIGFVVGGALALMSVLSGCSTVSGFAKDLGSMSEAARDAMSR